MASKTEEILAQRGNYHGHYPTQGGLSDKLVRTMENSNNWDHLMPFQREALRNIQMKISRILTGDPCHQDAYDDIAGYSELLRSHTAMELSSPRKTPTGEAQVADRNERYPG